MNKFGLDGKLLGKRAPIIDPRTFKLAKYLANVPPDPPRRADYLSRVADWPMYWNDTLGSCGPAAAGHMIEIWSANAAGKTSVPTNDEILKTYEDVGGYVLGDPSTDRGVFLLDLLKYWRATGIGGHKIVAYVKVDHRNRFEMRQAIALFGCILEGVMLPLSARNSRLTPDGRPVWEVPPQGPIGLGSPGSWGGHAIPVGEYSRRPADFPGIEHVTWGSVYKQTWSFFETYCDECFAVLSQDWLDADQLSPSGFDVNALFADLAALQEA